jgi:hypothetical protein
MRAVKTFRVVEFVPHGAMPGAGLISASRSRYIAMTAPIRAP